MLCLLQFCNKLGCYIIKVKLIYNQVSIDNKNNFCLFWEVWVYNYFVVFVVVIDLMGE